MTVMTSRIDRINRQHKQYDLARFVAGMAMLIPYLLGWTSRKIVITVWFVVSWLWAAAVVGWQAAAQNDRE